MVRVDWDRDIPEEYLHAGCGGFTNRLDGRRQCDDRTGRTSKARIDGGDTGKTGTRVAVSPVVASTESINERAQVNLQKAYDQLNLAIEQTEKALETLKASNAPASVQEAMEYAIMHASMVEEHAHESVHGNGIRQTHEHAAHAAALLVGAYGKADSDSPATGALSYAMKQTGLKASK